MADLILEIVEGDDAGRQTPLEDSIEIGREASTGLALDDEQASRRHARVTAQGDLALVEDLGSTNGTYLNGQPIEGQRTLRPGDRLRVGLTVFELRTAADVQRQPSAVIPVPQVTQLSAGRARAGSRARAHARPRGGSRRRRRAGRSGGAPAGLRHRRVPAGLRAAGGGGRRGGARGLRRRGSPRGLVRQAADPIATFALLALSGLAVIVVFGLIKQPSAQRGSIRRRREDAALRGWRGRSRARTPVGCADVTTCSSARITCITALISARWVKACGKLPRWRPVAGSISSAYSSSGLA